MKLKTQIILSKIQFKALIICILVIFFQHTFSQNNISLSTYNDLWGGGNTRVLDDFRSFGISAKSNFNKWEMFLDLSGLTYKTSPDSFSKKRIDELTCLLGYKILNKKYFKFNLNAGFQWFGKLGGEFLQKQTHLIFGVPKVELPYDKSKFYPKIEAKLQTKTLEKNRFYTNMESNLGVGAAFHTNFLLKLGWKNGLQNMGFQIGYDYYSPIFQSDVWKKVCSIESGVFIGYKHQTEIFDFEWKTWLSGFSQGILTIHVPISKSDSLKSTKISLNFGTWIKSEGYFYHVKIPISKKNENLQLLISHHFGTLVSKQLASYPDTLGHTRTIGLGAEYTVFKPKKIFFISPFGSISVGGREYQLYSTQNQYLQKKWTLTTLLQTGLYCSIRLPFYRQSRVGFSLQLMYVLSQTPHLILSDKFLKGGGIFLQL